MIKPTKLRAVDLFCGAGGMTLGAEQSGRVDVVLAVNHWRTAIFTHQHNHPETRHVCARIEDMDLRNEHDLPEVDCIMGGIECTHHSNARGSAPINDQRRTSAWRVLDWIARFHPRWCVFENVREFEKWGPIDANGKKLKSKAGEIFNAWVTAIRSHGYHVEWKLLNAAEYGEATRRLRLFIVCRRGRSSEPFAWPAPTHSTPQNIADTLRASGRDNRQRERTAAEIIDWSRECPSIFARKKQLADKTLKRIEAGLKKFVEPYLVYFKGSSTACNIRKPLGTVQTGGHWGVAVPFGFDIHNRRRDDTSRSLNRPMPTVVAKPGNSIAMPLLFAQGSRCDGRPANRPAPTLLASGQPWLAAPFLTLYHSGSKWDRSHNVHRPLATLDTQPRFALAQPYMVTVNHGGDNSRTNQVNQPLHTATSRRSQAVAVPFLTKYYGTDGAASVNQPLGTATAKPRFGLAMVSLLQTMDRLGVADIGFRMLDVDELAAAQGFPGDYYLHGNKADQIRQVGNAVCPGVMRAICGALQ